MRGFTSFFAASCFIICATGALANDSVTIAVQLEPPNLDPTGGAAQAIDTVQYHNVFEGLTRFEADGAVVPGLAQSWDIAEDGLAYTFNLVPGVTFHDGTQMTAEDVVFSLDRARAEDSTNAQTILAEDYVNGYLFELAYTSVVKADLQGLWHNQLTASVDVTALSWVE